MSFIKVYEWVEIFYLGQPSVLVEACSEQPSTINVCYGY